MIRGTLPRLTRVLALGLALTVFGHSPSRAGAWLQPAGDIYLKLSLFGMQSPQRVGPDGSLMPADPSGGDYVERMLYAYLEYGLIPRLTLLASIGAKDMQVEADPPFGTRSSGNLGLGGRWGLVQGPKAFSLEGVLWIPTYPASDLSQPPGQREQNLPAGTGQLEAELRALGGLSLFPLPLYANLDLGYRVRAGDFPDQWIGAFELGGGSRSFFSKLELRALAENGDVNSPVQVGSVAVAERSLRFYVEASLRTMGSMWAGAGYSAHLAGRNTLTGGQWQIFLVFLGSDS